MPRGHRKGFRWITPEARFWESVNKTDGCWEWTGYCMPFENHPELKGHGMITIDGRRLLVHRFAWELYHGPIPKGFCILHHCDNRPCVRDEHLFLGTKQDNTDDAMAKARLVKGEDTCTALLSEAQVLAIRDWYRIRAQSYTDVGKQYGVNEATIRAVVHHKNWKWLA